MWHVLSPLSTIFWFTWLDVNSEKKEVGRVIGKEEPTHALCLIQIFDFERPVDLHEILTSQEPHEDVGKCIF